MVKFLITYNMLGTYADTPNSPFKQSIFPLFLISTVAFISYLILMRNLVTAFITDWKLKSFTIRIKGKPDVIIEKTN